MTLDQRDVPPVKDAREVALRLQARRDELDRLDVEYLDLFGSLAEGRAKGSSDADFVVQFRHRANFRNFMVLGELLEAELGRKVDIGTDKALKPRLLETIRRVRVYAPPKSTCPNC